MPVFLEYIIKLNICLAVVYIFYQLLLRRLTFYNWNRWYLLGYTALSFIIPVINIMPSLQKQNLHESGIVQWIPVMSLRAAESTSFFETLTGWHWIIAGIVLGSLLLLGRLGVKLLAFARIKSKAQLISAGGTKIYQLDDKVMPFSFGNAIFVNTDLHTGMELEEIIRHEFVHTRQKHSIDIIWCELLCILNWFNPFAWLLRHNVRQNLEFIADDKVLQSGIDKKEYQYLLLKVIGNRHFVFTNHFNFSSLKKRIVMMNSFKTARIHLARFAFLFPVIAVLLLSFRTNTEKPVQNNLITGIPPVKVKKTDTIVIVEVTADQLREQKKDTTPKVKTLILSTDSSAKNPLFVIDGVPAGKESVNPDDIESITVLKGENAISRYGREGGNGVIEIKTKKEISTRPITLRFRDSADKQPLYVLDGQRVELEMVETLDPQKIEHMSVLKTPEVKALYGPEGENGVIMIETKNAGNTDVIILPEKKEVVNPGFLKNVDSTRPVDNQLAIRLIEEVDGNAKRKLQENLPENVFYVLNGEPVSQKRIKKIAPDDIKSIDVLKGTEAIKFYGKKAQRGAIIITTKK
ncbi:MAG: TonB-dependent receptor plug domain-containing protein [Chitinophagaceae bacterium]|nr:TonB-dependent receptor plug domain-containing protein [Chitinophagaceae bacterium]MCW5929627.1 TonB-dependent receptor plug domain-containing protein [Chitinophagaceae bacterium]